LGALLHRPENRNRFSKGTMQQISDSAGQREVSNLPVGVGTEAQCAQMADSS
jgi:hypothetical protein